MHCIFKYNILPTTHHNDLTFNQEYLIDCILEDKWIDLPSSVCYIMLKTAAAQHSISSLPFHVLITKIFTDQKVPFPQNAKVKCQTAHVSFSTLSKMHLIEKAGGSSKKTFKPNLIKSAAATAKASITYLLHSLIHKVTKMIKIKSKTGRSPNNPLVLESDSEDEEEKAVDEDYFSEAEGSCDANGNGASGSGNEEGSGSGSGDGEGLDSGEDSGSRYVYEDDDLLFL